MTSLLTLHTDLVDGKSTIIPQEKSLPFSVQVPFAYGMSWIAYDVLQAVSVYIPDR